MHNCLSDCRKFTASIVYDARIAVRLYRYITGDPLCTMDKHEQLDNLELDINTSNSGILLRGVAVFYCSDCLQVYNKIAITWTGIVLL